ncbi:MAG: hypothetical protein ACXWWU_09170 [Candidatus Limnocylindria bacterium]
MAPGIIVERLMGHLFGDDRASDAIATELAGWLTDSRRFRAFAEANRDKIRKKLRGATDADARHDVRTELRVAQLLLADRRIELAFEPYGSATGGPDFAVTYRTQRLFNLEVTRRRPGSRSEADGGALLAKLRQLPPSVANVVLVGATDDRAEPLDVPTAIGSLQARADAGEDRYFTERGLDGIRGFHQRFLRLGAVIAWFEGLHGAAGAVRWVNGSARIQVPEPAALAVLACLRAEASGGDG